MASLGGVVCDGFEEMLRCEGILGEFVCGGVQAEGVVEGWVGCRGGLRRGVMRLWASWMMGNVVAVVGALGGRRLPGR